MLRFPAGLATLAIGLGACGNATPTLLLQGGCTHTHSATVCTYAKVQGKRVVEVGATIPFAAIANVQAGQESMAWPPVAMVKAGLPLKARSQSGLTELTMYWEPTGHPPKPYMVPHFDFHFYLIPDGEVNAINCKDESKPSALPAGYSLPDQDLPPDMQKMIGVPKLVGVCVPMMGMHALPTAELQSTKPFSGTMMIGYYHAKPIFIEPMISQSMIMQKKSFTLPIPLIPGLTGAYPTTFHADYDAQSDSYRFSFTNFKGA